MNVKTLARNTLATATVALLSVGPAFAAGGFTVPEEVGDAKDAVLAVGLAVFGIAVGIKLYKWIKRAL